MVSVLVFGPIGCGKTFFLTRHIFKYHDRYDYIVSNFPLVIPGVEVHVWNEGYIKSGRTHTLYVLDEAWALWNSRNFEHFDTDVHDWFALSRHYDNTIMIACQSPNRIDKVIRELTQEFVYLTPRFRLPFVGHPLLFCAEHYGELPADRAVGGVPIPRAEPVSRYMYFFSKKVAAAYNTKSRSHESSDYTTITWVEQARLEDEAAEKKALQVPEVPEDDEVPELISDYKNIVPYEDIVRQGTTPEASDDMSKKNVPCVSDEASELPKKAVKY